MNVSFRALGLLAASGLLVACGGTSSTTNSPPTGGAATLSVADGHLTGAGGKALYLWEKDTGTTSVCNGACASGWPPLIATAVPTVSAPLDQSKVGLSPRQDGTKQVTYAGHPLYYYAGDSGAQDTHGEGSDGFGATWWLVDSTGLARMAVTSSASASSGGGYHY